ncbi:hypothetical protein C2845_PM01G20760 [Panicum miliaceum]|uniref:Uncharacterized protein n=1 Tax=Panicum miliaceum TaxID=4540 RepID=A0A3L6TRV9_PANMI|nr:hypothetical protein C2845_PM01G20760 [Panicum miliaceum]
MPDHAKEKKKMHAIAKSVNASPRLLTRLPSSLFGSTYHIGPTCQRHFMGPVGATWQCDQSTRPSELSSVR